jgi:hypothetical protein
MDNSPIPPPLVLLKAAETVRALLDAFPAGLDAAKSVDDLDTADVARFNKTFEELKSHSNGLYMSVALAGMILRWASNETGQTVEEILDLIDSQIE